jgi:hypothetical protein
VRVLLFTFCAAALPACTYAVLEGEKQPAHCVVVGDCAAGFACDVVSHTCNAVPDADAPPLPGVAVDAKGGDVLADGLSLHFEPGAVLDDVQVDVEKASATNIPVGFDASSGFFSIAPDAVLSGKVIITIIAAGCDTGCRVFKRPANFGDPWTELDKGSTSSGKVAGVLAATDVLSGVYVAGIPQ